MTPAITAPVIEEREKATAILTEQTATMETTGNDGIDSRDRSNIKLLCHDDSHEDCYMNDSNFDSDRALTKATVAKAMTEAGARVDKGDDEGIKER